MPVLTVVGDVLLDRDLLGRVERVAPDRPVPVLEGVHEVVRPGGAGMAAALSAARTEVRLVGAFGSDGAGAELRTLLAEAGVTVVELALAGSTPEKIRLRAGDHALARVDRGGGDDDVGAWTAAAAEALATSDAVLVSDYGRGVTRHADVRLAVAAAARRVPVVWDPHPRGGDPVPGVDLVTPNEAEAARFAAGGPHPPGLEARSAAGVSALAAWGRLLVQRWRSPVAITAGERGALLVEPDGAPAFVPAVPATGDANGAGDVLAATYALARACGEDRLDALHAGVAAASALVSGTGRSTSGGAADPDAVALAARVRAGGGTVVAAGGCFDLLHAGHVSLLQAARRLGDCLIVCVNSDRSVRRLKGVGRPVNGEKDRAAVLLGLGCVDGVALFDEDTPCEVLERLRPHLFAKGDDYRGATLPEAAALAGWGGEIVLLPRVAGRSTTRIIERVSGRATA